MERNNTKKFIYLTILLIPFYWVRFLIFNTPTNLVEVLIILTSLTWFIENIHNLKKVFKNSLDIFTLFLSFIFLGLVVATIFNDNIQAGLGIIKGWLILPLLFAFIVQREARNRQDMLSVLKYIYLSGIVVTVISLTSYFFNGLTYDNRLRGLYLSPNFLSMYLSPVFIIGFWDLFVSNLHIFKTKTARITIFLAMLVTLFLTYSYAAWLAIILSVTITLSIKKLSTQALRKILTALFLVGILLFFSQISNQKFLDIITFNERSSLSSRMMIWKSTLKIINDNWLIGIGPGNFQPTYLSYQKYFTPYLEWAVPHPHNIFAAFWLNSGLLGFFSFLILIYIWVKTLFKKIKKDTTASTFSLFLCIILYILMHGIFDTTYWKNDLSIIFWIIFSLGYYSKD
ncbi:O-antigen ligase family protein [Patescibacteria group bacterium]